MITNRCHMKFASKLLLFLRVGEPYYPMIPYYLDCRISGKAWKTLAIFFYLWCYALYISMPRCKAWLLIFKSISTNQLFPYFLLKPSCPSQWQKKSNPLLGRETAFCSDWKWIGSILSNPWHFQKNILKVIQTAN